MAPLIPDRYATRDAMVSLARRFGLPIHPFSQDWEYEVADPSRFDEFLDAYESGVLDEDERFTLMRTLIQCVEDMDSASVESSPQWHSVASMLRVHAGIHACSIRYWSCLDEDDLENCFRVTGPMRAIWEDIRRIEAGARDSTSDG